MYMKRIFTSFILLLTVSIIIKAQNSGDFDTTFGNNGYVITSVNNNFNTASANTIQADGKILVTGQIKMSSQNYNIGIIRLNSDGSLDESFGENGIVVTEINNKKAFPNNIFVLNDGKILITGYLETSLEYGLMLLRYNPDGSLDSSFGENNGYTVVNINQKTNVAEAAFIQEDGKIILGGHSNFTFATYRFNKNGTVDQTFGNNGMVNENHFTSPINFIKSIVVQNDGKIVAGGFVNGAGGYNFAMVRYEETGNIDTSFGDNGIIAQSVGEGHDFITSLALQDDGKIIAGGHKWIANEPVKYDFIVARYNSDGSLDSSFGENGIGSGSAVDGGNYILNIKLQTDGKIVAVGQTQVGDTWKSTLIRFNDKGVLDNAFGNNGVATGMIVEPESSFNHVSIQDDGNIITSGFAYVNNSFYKFITARYIGGNLSTIDESISKLEFKIYPNPTTDIINIESSINFDYYEIIDASGRVINNNAVNNSKINVKSLNKGIYFINLFNKSELILREKFIKK